MQDLFTLLNELDYEGRYALADSILNKYIKVAVYEHIDPLQVMGLSEDFTPEELKSAYRNLARTYHPDINPDPDASEQFKILNHAHQLLNSGKYKKHNHKKPQEETWPQSNNMDEFHYDVRGALDYYVFNHQLYSDLIGSEELKKYYKFQIGKYKVPNWKISREFSNVYKLRHEMAKALEHLRHRYPDMKGNYQTLLNIVSQLNYLGYSAKEIRSNVSYYLKFLDD